MLWKLLWAITERLTGLLTHTIRSLLLISFLFSMASALGWVQRLLWFLAEHTASHLWNGTPVTIGSLEVDLLRGRVWATNVVIHTPKRDEWEWDSPLICRIGKVYCEHNWFSSFFSMLFRVACTGQLSQNQIVEIYTLELSDVQGFIERKQHIFNFYLMDRLFVLPDPKEILEEEKEIRRKTLQEMQQQQQQQKHVHSQEQQSKQDDTSSTGYYHHYQQQPNPLDNQSEASVDLNFDQDEVKVSYNTPAASSSLGPLHQTEDGKKYSGIEEQDDNDKMAHRQAQQLVDEMFSAVKSIGRAARQRGSIAMALQEQRAQLTTRLKAMKGTKNKSEAMQEGIKVIQRVGQAVAKKSKDIQMLPKMPPRKKPTVPPVYGRVGRVVVEDARIFTRTSTSSSSWLSASNESTAGNKRNNHDNIHPVGDTGGNVFKEGSTAMATNGLGAKWNKPIGISEIVLRSSELCPPASLVDENGLPAVYQPLDKIIEVVWKRALVGMAKSNTSRFLQTILGEMLEFEYLNLGSDANGAFSDAGSTSGGNAPSQKKEQPASSAAPTFRRGIAPSTLLE